MAMLDEMDFAHREMKTLALRRDDLLVCEGGEIGRTAIWRAEIDDCYYQNHLHRLRATRPDVCPLFHMYWMQEAFLVQRLYLGTAIRTTIPNLSQSRLKMFVLPLPPLPEQQAIARILGIVERELQVEENRKQGLTALFKSLLHYLMTGKMRVKPEAAREEGTA